MANPGLKRLAEDRGITTLAQFYTSEVKYPRDFFEACSEAMRKFYEEKKFLP